MVRIAYAFWSSVEAEAVERLEAGQQDLYAAKSSKWSHTSLSRSQWAKAVKALRAKTHADRIRNLTLAHRLVGFFTLKEAPVIMVSVLRIGRARREDREVVRAVLILETTAAAVQGAPEGLMATTPLEDKHSESVRDRAAI